MSQKKNTYKVSIIMGSQSDYSTMQYCQKVLKILKIKFETKLISAHRTPNRMYEFAKKAYNNAKNIEGNLDDNMPHWWRSFKEKVEGKHSEAQQKGSEQGRWYHYEYDQHGRPSKHPDAGEFTDLKNGSGRPPSRWRPKVYLKYIKRYGLNDKGW